MEDKMSYCRDGKHSDVYLYHDCQLGLVCVNCKIRDGKMVYLATEKDALLHLIKHKLNNNKVPIGAIRRLSNEIADTGETYG
jgi:hypothetical protein